MATRFENLCYTNLIFRITWVKCRNNLQNLKKKPQAHNFKADGKTAQDS